ncbi:hypothetical protein Tco_0363125 [Tanacetum coccineum]
MCSMKMMRSGWWSGCWSDSRVECVVYGCGGMFGEGFVCGRCCYGGVVGDKVVDDSRCTGGCCELRRVVALDAARSTGGSSLGRNISSENFSGGRRW